MDEKTIAHYEVLDELGAGGMGVVYRARDTRLDRMAAIKALPEELAEDSERLARFEREAKLLASLKNPYIATVYGLEEVEGRRFLAMELVEGQEAGKQSDIWAFGCVLSEMLAGKRAFPVGIMGDAEVEPA